MDKTLIILGILVIAAVGVTAAMVVTSPAVPEAAHGMPPAPGNPNHPNDPTVQTDLLTFGKQFVMDDATFQFDGMADTVNATIDGNVVTVTFTSRQAGYGNRSAMMLAQVLTPHTAVLTITGNQITSAVMDGTWDMLTQKEITK